ncbi:MAG: hypothetical protein IKK34_01560 [Clostridia bacterium]|nr:hypothetical protein [Clostridia bacterium]
MSVPAAIQKRPPAPWALCDPDFTDEFYRPYAAAVENAFLLLDDARCRLMLENPADAVRSMIFRLKTPASIRGKLLKKCLPATAEAAGACLQDIAGLRVVLSSVGAVYRFAALLKSSAFAQCIEESDYIASPKKSGYRSLHLILRVPVCLRSCCLMIPVEIQLRTAGMDVWASIEHEICYKPVK